MEKSRFQPNGWYANKYMIQVESSIASSIAASPGRVLNAQLVVALERYLNQCETRPDQHVRLSITGE